MGIDGLRVDLSAWGARVGEEARKNFPVWLRDGFYQQYLSGEKVLDIGFDGYLDDVVPITPRAIGVGIDYPGYDSKTLPFADASQDTVFVSHCLEHIEDYRTVISDWFRVLKTGGYLIVLVPHQYLYERNISLPSKFNMDHRRFYTPASLLREIEESINPINYRVRLMHDNDRDFDYSINPEKHASGCYEILLVIEKIPVPDYAEALTAPPKIRTVTKGTYTPHPRPTGDNPTFAVVTAGAPRSIIAFKMDHLGDFLLATPALGHLRQAFPDAQLTFVCGEWNANAAQELNIFDEVIPFSIFERNAALNGVESLHDRLKKFEKLMAGREFDLAVDLRVDADTRPILQQVRAKKRAGIGRKRDFAFLDIALPLISPTSGGRALESFFDASCFIGCFGEHKGHEILVPGDAYPTGVNLIYGPYRPFLPSRYHIRMLIADDLGQVPPCDYDIVWDAENLRLQAGRCEDIATTGVWLDIDDPIEHLEIRIWTRGEEVRPFRFRGCTISKVGQMEGPHQTEMMAMLVALIQQRSMFSPTEEQTR